MSDTEKENGYILCGWEFNNLWKAAELYQGLNEHEILMTTDEWEKAEVFKAIEPAEYKRQFLQANYPEITWYILMYNQQNKEQ